MGGGSQVAFGLGPVSNAGSAYKVGLNTPLTTERTEPTEIFKILCDLCVFCGSFFDKLTRLDPLIPLYLTLCLQKWHKIETLPRAFMLMNWHYGFGVGVAGKFSGTKSRVG